MTRFEEIGRDKITLSVTMEQCDRNFKKSCELCCTRGMRLECERCAINDAYDTAKFIFKYRASQLQKVLA